MTKNNEQIIIDDLDTRCPYHCSEKIGQCNNPSPENKYVYCFDYKDCIYKLYARKEQECEELKEEVALLKESNSKLQPIEDANSIEKGYLQQLDQLKKENEELKLENKKLENANNALHDDLFEIKQKNKQYKENSEAYKKCYENNLKNLKDAEFNLTKLVDKYMKLEKTLEEIREIAWVNPVNTCWEVLNLCDKCEEKDDCEMQSPFAKLKLIEQKVNEVINEKI